MAVVFYNVHDQAFCLVEQSGWGTAAATNAAGKGIHCEGFDIPAQFRFIEPTRAREQRYHKVGDLTAHTKGLMYEFTIPAHPYLKDQGDYWLYGVMQNVSEGTATPFVKTFTFGQTQPDFTADAGLFMSIIAEQPVASTSAMLSDAICSQVVLTCSPTANDGLLMVEPTIVGRTHLETFNYSGTITYPDVAIATDFYTFWDITSAIGTEDLIFGDDGFTITITNGVKPVGNQPTAAGYFETYGLTFYRAVAEFQMLWDAAARAEMALAVAGGGSNTLAISWGTAASDGRLSITLDGKYSNPRELSKVPEGEFVTLTMEGEGTYDSVEPLEIDHANAIDRAW